MNICNENDLYDLIKKNGINYQYSEGNTILHNLSKIGNMKLLNYLFEYKDDKINVNIKNNMGRTALYYSLNEEIVEFLLSKNINYFLKDNNGKYAHEINEYVNYVANQKCNNTKKNILKYLM